MGQKFANSKRLKVGSGKSWLCSINTQLFRFGKVKRNSKNTSNNYGGVK